MITDRILTIKTFNDYRLRVVIYDDVNEIKDRWEFGEGNNGKTYMWTWKTCIIVPYNDLPTTVHEIEHAKNSILNAAEHKPDYNNDEIDAYLMGYIFKEIEKLREIHKKKVA